MRLIIGVMGRLIVSSCDADVALGSVRSAPLIQRAGCEESHSSTSWILTQRGPTSNTSLSSVLLCADLRIVDQRITGAQREPDN
ncbi:hypothetical protein QQF64_006477 [Cirrhinus molitorella]|uniref:Secreted protein n=1 Tax=Cirrhinus molitorella TaxID=172907 RepID=A0ABR3MF72_9TELE